MTEQKKLSPDEQMLEDTKAFYKAYGIPESGNGQYHSIEESARRMGIFFDKAFKRENRKP